MQRRGAPELARNSETLCTLWVAPSLSRSKASAVFSFSSVQLLKFTQCIFLIEYIRLHLKTSASCQAMCLQTLSINNRAPFLKFPSHHCVMVSFLSQGQPQNFQGFVTATDSVRSSSFQAPREASAMRPPPTRQLGRLSPNPRMYSAFCVARDQSCLRNDVSKWSLPY